MIFIEIVALAMMLFTLSRVVRYALAFRREMILPVFLYLTVSVMLFFAAFGGDSGLVTDPETMITRIVGALVLVALVAGYFMLVKKARDRARDADGGGA
ncbi:MAG: hypothetical protein AAF577_02715 [Pseudomonadota bacterium]